MDVKHAKNVLTEKLNGEHEEFSDKQLHSLGWYLSVESGDAEATLDGTFTADQLEAIAMWMRDPKGICSA